MIEITADNAIKIYLMVWGPLLALGAIIFVSYLAWNRRPRRSPFNWRQLFSRGMVIHVWLSVVLLVLAWVAFFVNHNWAFVVVIGLVVLAIAELVFNGASWSEKISQVSMNILGAAIMQLSLGGDLWATVIAVTAILIVDVAIGLANNL